jgi:hypothetical protein|nr:MAG TPA: hypothetical protein [Caudoviricetes sp.]
MKAFDVEKALAGEPVKLKNGDKAIIFGRIPEGLEWSHIGAVNHPLVGVVLNAEGKITDSRMRWSMSGVVDSGDDEKRAYDVISMWEDDIATIIERAAKEDLPVKLRDGTKAWVVALAPPERFQGSYSSMGYGNTRNYSWTKEGYYYRNTVSPFDILGLWENEE